MNSKELLEKLQKQLTKNEIESVIEQLKELFAHTPKLKHILQQEARYNRLVEQIHLGTISRDNADVAKNKMFIALFNFISEAKKLFTINKKIGKQDLFELVEEIEKQTAENTDLHEEMQQAITNIYIVKSKNVIANGSVSSGRDTNIGDVIHNYYNYGDKKVKRFLTLPPSKPSIFIGRTNDIQTIHTKLFQTNENILLLVNGEGGIGKTTLAAAYFHQYHEKYQHLAWVFVATNIVNALLSLNISLKVPMPERATTAQRLDFLLLEMSSLNKPCLLIIDNANDIEDLAKYEPKLRQCPNFHLLLTSRINECGDMEFYKIKPLEKDFPKQLFEQHYPKLKAEELPILEKILKAIDNNTLVIELLGKSLRQKNRLKQRYQLKALYEDLQTKGLFQLQTDKKVNTNWGEKRQQAKASSEEVIAAMYDLEQLNEQECLLLSNLSVLPAEYLPYEMLEPLLKHIAELDDIVQSLYEKGWLDYDESEETAKIKVSPVIQAVCRQKNNSLFEDCQNLIYEIAVKLKTEGGSGHLVNVTYEEAAIYVQYSEYLISKLKGINHNFAVLHTRIGIFYTTIGNLETALSYFEQYNDLEKELYESYPQNVSFKNGLAISYSKLGDTHSSLGNLETALSFFEQYNDLEKELYESYPQNVSFKNGLAISYSKLGDTHSSLGNLETALSFFEQYNDLEKELYESYPQNVSFKNGLA
ncbi:MAG: NB-ARC domain-containing protein, partial [Chitinophagales bacterium]